MYLVPLLNEEYKPVKDSNGKPIMVEVPQQVYEFWAEDLKNHRKYLKELENRLSFFDLELWNTLVCLSAGSAENDYFREASKTPEEVVIAAMREALKSCTETQRRRFAMYIVDGMNYQQIADKERKTRRAVQKSIVTTINKIMTVLRNGVAI